MGFLEFKFANNIKRNCLTEVALVKLRKQQSVLCIIAFQQFSNAEI